MRSGTVRPQGVQPWQSLAGARAEGLWSAQTSHNALFTRLLISPAPAAGSPRPPGSDGARGLVVERLCNIESHATQTIGNAVPILATPNRRNPSCEQVYPLSSRQGKKFLECDTPKQPHQYGHSRHSAAAFISRAMPMCTRVPPRMQRLSQAITPSTYPPKTEPSASGMGLPKCHRA